MHEHLQRTTAIFEIDLERNVVVRASFITVHHHTSDFLSNLASGYDLSQGIQPLLQEMEERAHLSSIHAFMKATEIAYQRYLEFRASKGII